MLEVLQFVFSSFWVFLGTLMLTHIIVYGVLAALISIPRRFARR